MKENSEFYTSDGRIDADKAFEFVLDRMKTMPPEEFAIIRDTPVQFRSAKAGSGQAQSSVQGVKSSQPPCSSAATGAVPNKAAKRPASAQSTTGVKGAVKASAVSTSKHVAITKTARKKSGA